MKRIVVFACVALAGALLTSAQARIIGRSAEISIGRETASLVEDYFVVDRDAVATTRVRSIGRRLAACAKDPDFPFEFHVVEDPEVNAFALPGGFVYVFRGLLQLCPNDDALASVLAHEISHVTRRHAIRQFEKSLLLRAGITAVLAGTGVRGAGTASEVVQAVAGLSFTRGDEADADAQGIEMLARAGYDPNAAVQAMEILKRTGGKDHTPALLRSHPAPDSRIRTLKELAADVLARRERQRRDARDLPAPPPIPIRRIEGLEGIRLAACPWFPLGPGGSWTYRVRGDDSSGNLTVRVLDAVNAEPTGVYRVEYDLGRGVRTVRLVVPAGDRVYSRGESGGEAFRAEAVFAAEGNLPRGAGSVRFCLVEKVQVPAGEYEAVKLELLDAASAIQATHWYAKGVGLVRSVSAGGSTRELTVCRLPGSLGSR